MSERRMLPTLSISKWYMDCVSEAGDVVLGYSTVLSCSVLKLGYSSTLEHREASKPSTHVSARAFKSPEFDGAKLRWVASPLGVDGEWVGAAPPIEKRLLQRDDGSVDWCCCLPRARARIVAGSSGEVVEGLGYAERLRMTLQPWRLPIEELRWGRFLSEMWYVVWIDWRGPHPLRLVYLNGVPLPANSVGDDGLSLPNGVKLLLEERTVLREGPLVSTVFSKTPLLRCLIPKMWQLTHECKWRSRGRLVQPGQEDGQGWAIHEVVRWGGL